MIYQLFLNLALILVLFVVLDILYSTKLSIPVTIYITDVFSNTSRVNLVFLSLYAILMFIFYSFIGVISVFIRSFIYSQPSVLEVFLIFLVSNIMCLVKDILPRDNYIFYNSYLLYFGYLGMLIERTIGLFVGGFIVLSILGQQ